MISYREIWWFSLCWSAPRDIGTVSAADICLNVWFKICAVGLKQFLIWFRNAKIAPGSCPCNSIVFFYFIYLKQNVYHLKCLLNNHRLYTFNFSNFPMSMLLFGSLYLLQVNLCQKHLFSHQLTHKMTKDCSLNYMFSTSKLKAQNMGRTWVKHVVYILT